MPLNMLMNGATTKYMAVITAEGQRGGQTVTIVNSSPFEVDVTQNKNLKPGEWSANTALKAAQPNSTSYDSGPLAGYVTGMDGEEFTFSVVPNSEKSAARGRWQ